METRCSMAQARGEGASEVWPVWPDMCMQARHSNNRCRRVMGVMSRKSGQAMVNAGR